MANELSVRQSANIAGSGSGSSVYDRVADPLAFVEQIGKVFATSGACGVQTPAQGQLLALACLCEQRSPFDIGRRYHLIDGKLSMRADAMLAEFRARGGKHVWTVSGDDGQRAEARFIYDGNDCTVSYSIDDAKRAKLVRSGGNWEKDPGSMLRARVISKGVRMLAPEVVSGVYTPEELAEIRDANEEPPRPQRTAEEVAARRAEIQAASGQAVQAAATTVAATEQQQPPPWNQTEVAKSPDAVIDVQSTPVQPAAAAAATAAAATVENNIYAVLMEIELTLKDAGVTKDQLLTAMKAKNASIAKLEDLTIDQAKGVLANLRSKIEKARGKN